MMKKRLGRMAAYMMAAAMMGAAGNPFATDMFREHRDPYKDETDEERRLPRKMKKGFRVKYQRNTKWKRKAASWLARNQIELAGNLCIKEEELVFEGRKIK